MAWKDFGKQGFRRFIPPTSVPVVDHIGEALGLMPPGGRIADFGAGGRRIRSDVFTIDFDAGRGPDLVADLTALPVPDCSFDGVFCTGTLEHVRDPEKVGGEIARTLRPNGIACIDVPFLQGFHADPCDYRRWTLPGLQRFVADLQLKEIRSGVHLGPASTVTWIMSEYCKLLVGGPAARAAAGAARIVCAPLHIADRWLVRRDGAHRIACGVYVIARKPPLA